MSPALLEEARVSYRPDRGPNGEPSYEDFVEFMLPHLREAVAVTWSSARPVPGYDGIVRELVTRPHSMFGPARVTAYDQGDTVWLIGFEEDRSFWRDLDDPKS